MKGYCDDIEKATIGNEDFRRVLYTAKHLQLVVMTLPPGCDIGEEVHEGRDQFFRIEEGKGEIRIDGVANRVEDDFVVIVPAGARHNVINTGDAPLKLYTIYGPPEHRDGVCTRPRNRPKPTTTMIIGTAKRPSKPPSGPGTFPTGKADSHFSARRRFLWLWRCVKVTVPIHLPPSPFAQLS